MAGFQAIKFEKKWKNFSYMMVRRIRRTDRTARMMMMAVSKISSLTRLAGSITSLLLLPPWLMVLTHKVRPLLAPNSD
jgi:hypothetical protein